MRKSTRVKLAMLALAVVFTVGCEKASISEILANPSKFRDKEVGVVGTVTNSFGLLNMGGYEIEDDTGRIYVISQQGVPAKGERVLVEGTVFTGAMVMGRAVGVAIRETKHRVR